MTLDPRTSRRVFFMLAWLCLAAAGALMVWNRGASRQIAMLAVLCGVGLGRKARATGSYAAAPTTPTLTAPAPRKPINWALGALSIVAVVAAYGYLNYAQAHGGSNPLPVYLFAVAIGAMCWWLLGLLTRWL